MDDLMGAKVGVLTVGAWPGQIEMVIDRLTALNVYVGKFTGEERLLQVMGKGMLTHLLISQDGALSATMVNKLKASNVEVLAFRDVGRIV